MSNKVTGNLTKKDIIFKDIVANSITGVFLHQKGRYVYVNKKFADLHGYSVKELLGIEYLALVHPEDKESIKKLVSKELDGKVRSARQEVRRIRNDGTTIWCEMMTKGIQYKGNPAIMGNVIDITFRKHAEQALRENEERYRELVETSPVGISILIQEKAVYVNNTLAKMVNFKPEEIIDRPLMNFVHPDDRHIVRERIDSLKTGKRTVTSTYRLIRSDLKEVFVEVTSANIIYQGQPAVQAVFHNISERKQSEEKLKESEARYRTIFEQALDGIVLIEQDSGLIVDCNSKFEILSGIPLDSLKKMSVYELMSSSDIMKVFGEIIEDRIRQPKGKTIPIEYLSNRITVQNKEYIQSIVRDISELKRAEQALQRAGDQYRDLAEHTRKAAATLEILQQIVREMGHPGHKSHVSSPLNARELEILQLASQGLSDKGIAERLSVSSKTVGAHFRYIFAKLGVKSRTEAIYKALKNEWITLA